MKSTKIMPPTWTLIAVIVMLILNFLLPFVILIDRIYIRVEERMLAKKFGIRWNEYKTKTRRWL